MRSRPHPPRRLTDSDWIFLVLAACVLTAWFSTGPL